MAAEVDVLGQPRVQGVIALVHLVAEPGELVAVGDQIGLAVLLRFDCSRAIPVGGVVHRARDGLVRSHVQGIGQGGKGLRLDLVGIGPLRDGFCRVVGQGERRLAVRHGEGDDGLVFGKRSALLRRDGEGDARGVDRDGNGIFRGVGISVGLAVADGGDGDGIAAGPGELNFRGVVPGRFDERLGHERLTALRKRNEIAARVRDRRPAGSLVRPRDDRGRELLRLDDREGGRVQKIREARVFQAVGPGVDAEGAAEPREDGRILQLRRGLGRAGGVLAAVLAGQGAVLAIEGVRDRSIAAACDWAEGTGISRHIHDHIGVLDLCSGAAGHAVTDQTADIAVAHDCAACKAARDRARAVAANQAAGIVAGRCYGDMQRIALIHGLAGHTDQTADLARAADPGIHYRAAIDRCRAVADQTADRTCAGDCSILHHAVGRAAAAVQTADQHTGVDGYTGDRSGIDRQVLGDNVGMAKQACKFRTLRYLYLEVGDHMSRAVERTAERMARIHADGRKRLVVQVNICGQHIIGVIDCRFVRSELAQIRQFFAAFDLVRIRRGAGAAGETLRHAAVPRGEGGPFRGDGLFRAVHRDGAADALIALALDAVAVGLGHEREGIGLPFPRAGLLTAGRMGDGDGGVRRDVREGQLAAGLRRQLDRRIGKAGRLGDRDVAGSVGVAEAGRSIVTAALREGVNDLAGIVLRRLRRDGLSVFALALGQGEVRGRGDDEEVDVIGLLRQRHGVGHVGRRDGEGALLLQIVVLAVVTGDRPAVAALIEAGIDVCRLVLFAVCAHLRGADAGCAGHRDGGVGRLDRQRDGKGRIRVLPLEGGIGIRVCKRAAERGRQRFEFLRGLRGALLIFGAAAGQIEAGGRFRAVAGAVAKQRFCIGPSRDAAGGIAVRGRAAQIANQAAKVFTSLKIAPVVAVFNTAACTAGNTAKITVVILSTGDRRLVIAQQDRSAAMRTHDTTGQGRGGIDRCVVGNSCALIRAPCDRTAVGTGNAAYITAAKDSRVLQRNIADRTGVGSCHQCGINAVACLRTLDARVCDREVMDAAGLADVAEQAGDRVFAVHVQAGDGLAVSVKVAGEGGGAGSAHRRPLLRIVPRLVEGDVFRQNALRARLAAVHEVCKALQLCTGRDLIDVANLGRHNAVAFPGIAGRQRDVDRLRRRADRQELVFDLLIPLGLDRVGIAAGGKVIDGRVRFPGRHHGLFAVPDSDGDGRIRGRAGHVKGNGDLVRSRQRILNLKVCAVDLERDIFLALIAKQLCGVDIAAVREDPGVCRLRDRLDGLALLDGDGRVLGHVGEHDVPDLRPDGVEVHICAVQRDGRAVGVFDRAARRLGPAVKAVTRVGEGVLRQVSRTEDALLTGRVRAVVGVEDDLVREGDGEVLQPDTVARPIAAEVLLKADPDLFASLYLHTVGGIVAHLSAERFFIRLIEQRLRFLARCLRDPVDLQIIPLGFRRSLIGESQLCCLQERDRQTGFRAADFFVCRNQRCTVFRYFQRVDFLFNVFRIIGNRCCACQCCEEVLERSVGIRYCLDCGNGVDARVYLFRAAVGVVVLARPALRTDHDGERVARTDRDGLVPAHERGIRVPAGPVVIQRIDLRIRQRAFEHAGEEVLVVRRRNDLDRLALRVAERDLIVGGVDLVQINTGHGEAGQGLVCIIRDTANVRAAEAGVLHADLIAAAQLFSCSVIRRQLIREPIVEREHPAASAALFQSVDRRNIGIRMGHGIPLERFFQAGHRRGVLVERDLLVDELSMPLCCAGFPGPVAGIRSAGIRRVIFHDHTDRTDRAAQIERGLTVAALRGCLRHSFGLLFGLLGRDLFGRSFLCRGLFCRSQLRVVCRKLLCRVLRRGLVRGLRLIDDGPALRLARSADGQRIAARRLKRKLIGRPAVRGLRAGQRFAVQTGGVLHRLAVRLRADRYRKRRLRRGIDAICQCAVQTGLDRDRLLRGQRVLRSRRQHVHRQNADEHDQCQDQTQYSFFHVVRSFFFIFLRGRICSADKGRIYAKKPPSETSQTAAVPVRRAHGKNERTAHKISAHKNRHCRESSS